jgi:hypothetical protein
MSNIQASGDGDAAIDAILIGGPRDQTQFHSAHTAVVILEVDGFAHRYIRTTATRTTDSGELLGYNYDGEVRPGRE